MKLKPIINSLLDTDLYKFNMNQVIFHYHTNLVGEYIFLCRNDDVIFTEDMLDEINKQIDHLCTLSFKEDELSYLKTIRFLKEDYIEFLRLWHPIRNYVETSLINNKLSIKIRGPLFSAMQFEIYLLSIVNEVYFKMKYDYSLLQESADKRLEEKIRAFKEKRYTFSFSDFGTRRRLSFTWQKHVIKRLKEENIINSTSNVFFAKEFHMIPTGTYAHEFVLMYQGIKTIPLAYTNKASLKDWFKEYKGDNGIALTDTITTDIFLKDFDFLESSIYRGVRHDSGDPFLWGEKILSHYKSLNIDSRNKILLFSDGLDFDRAQKIFDYFKDRCIVRFGIGTYLTNDTCVEPLNIVIKLQYVNDRPVAKLSDVKGKAMCQDENYLKYLDSAVRWRIENE